MRTPMPRHGFRHDPMTWAGEDLSSDAAWVRTRVLGEPRDGDDEIIQGKIDEIFEDQREDGTFGDTAKDTGAALLWALESGAPHDRPEVRRAAEAALHQARTGRIADEQKELGGNVLSVHELHALCLLGMTDEPEVRGSLEWYVKHPDEWNDPWKGCPWTPSGFWRALWAGRGCADVEGVIRDGLSRVAEEMNDVGCLAYNDPWGFLDAAGGIELPEAKALVAKQIPLILRSQHPDGSFGMVSTTVFRALHQKGLLRALGSLPPLPDEWRVVREVPLPGGLWFSLAWDGRDFWSFDHETKTATALSSTDGSVIRRVPIADCHAIGWWDGALAALGNEPRQLRRIDPSTGDVLQTISLDHMRVALDPEKVGRKILVGDRFLGCVSIHDPEGKEKPRLKCLAGPFPACLAAEGDTVWHADRWAPAIIRSDLNGKLVDWGGKPFGIQGMTFDGRRLWALDGEAKRIKAIERVGLEDSEGPVR